MTLSLVDDWRTILKKAWSMRLIGLASALMAIDAALPFFAPDHPSKTFAYSALGVSLLAGFARLIPQKGLSDGNDK